MDNNVLQEIIDYFTEREGYDSDDLITDLIAEIPELKACYADDFMITDINDDQVMNLEDFSRAFYEKIMIAICNVVESFKAN